MRPVEDHLIETLVAYSIEVRGRVVIVENVPARLDPETGERFFSPETVDQLRAILWSDRQPDRVIETPVFRFGG
ncbi:MAG TPA: hypothetical protein VF665_12920 [Longimicrobium sp.]|uniref:hypothetical protein n=1 Tax=Longimicrobium sp. TaxID=2029185 RepID=UPI002ED77B9C